MSALPSSIQQVFIRGIDPNRGYPPGRAMVYTATVDLVKATRDDLFQEISFWTGIQMPLLQHQFRFITNKVEQVIPDAPLASQGIQKEDTLRLEWRAGVANNRECPICFEEISLVARRLLCCQQTLADGTLQMQMHPTAFHVQCLERLRENEKIQCPLCRGTVTADALVIP